MQAPAWLKEAIFYQIMPDRFRRCSPAGSSSMDLMAWDAAPGSSRNGGREYFGGNLRGITERLDHIRELGANAILLTPVRGPLYHR